MGRSSLGLPVLISDALAIESHKTDRIICILIIVEKADRISPRTEVNNTDYINQVY